MSKSVDLPVQLFFQPAPHHNYLAWDRPDEVEALHARSLPLRQAVSAALPATSRIPVSVCALPAGHGALGLAAYLRDGIALCLRGDAPGVVVLHELTHLVLHLEGYPWLNGPYGGVLASALLDPEVDRRVALTGAPVGRVHDAQSTGFLLRPLTNADPTFLLFHYLQIAGCGMADPALQQRCLEHVHAVQPAVATLGDAVIAARGPLTELADPTRATHALRRMTRVLERAGLGVYRLFYRRNDILTQARTNWVRPFAQFQARTRIPSAATENPPVRTRDIAVLAM